MKFLKNVHLKTLLIMRIIKLFLLVPLIIFSLVSVTKAQSLKGLKADTTSIVYGCMDFSSA